MDDFTLNENAIDDNGGKLINLTYGQGQAIKTMDEDNLLELLKKLGDVKYK